MKPIKPRDNHPASRQRGIVLIDALIAIVIFSIGILGMVKLQSQAVSYSSDAKYRTDAAMLAEQIIGQMWGADPSQLQSNFQSPGGSGFVAWNAIVQQAMPDATDYPPTVVVDNNGNVTVTVNWKAPTDVAPDGTPQPHQYVSVTQVVK